MIDKEFFTLTLQYGFEMLLLNTIHIYILILADLSVQ